MEGVWLVRDRGPGWVVSDDVMHIPEAIKRKVEYPF